MWTLHTANADHWVPIKTVSSFRRMRDYAAKGHDFILCALRSSTELEVDEKGENVRRATELQKPRDQFERSVYAVRAFFLFLSDSDIRGPMCFDLIERVWEGGAGSAAETGGVFRNIREGECREDASCGWEKGVQGALLSSFHVVYNHIHSIFIGFRVRGVC